MMILIDTNILSAFAKIDRLELLFKVFNEYMLMLQLPKYLGKGELDSIAICTRRNYILLSNERKVISFCEENEIDHFDLNGILNALWILDIVSKEEVVQIINEMEDKDNLNSYKFFLSAIPFSTRFSRSQLRQPSPSHFPSIYLCVSARRQVSTGLSASFPN